MKFLLFIFCLFSGLTTKAQNLDEVIKFIKDNPKKASLYLIEDGNVTVNYNSQQIMPLASAVKTIIAIEFAKQAVARKINPQAKVAINQLNKYYIANTDGGAQPNWLKSISKLPTDSVTLLEVAKGMIKFSSNANTEFLQDLLGLNNINKSLKVLGLQNHQPLYYFTAAALMTCLKPNDVAENTWLTSLSALSDEAYRKKCNEAHLKLKTDSNFIKTVKFSNLSLAVQRVWSDRLVASTTETYAAIMKKIADKFFEPQVQNLIESILEWPMAYAGNKTQFNHLGQKGGSTAFILTDAFYAETKNGTKLACAFFFNHLTTAESTLIQKGFGSLEGSILTNKDFRLKLANALR